ncbi:hypothetical protein [Limnohabitans sp. G3-2]|uniref:hypothetical protein n=1 Tax=Limnohabitans sp. G3-2 TaxID=1100711 RepID=UPI000C1F8E9B|nr:hypothetical protein [Limnohabitans sp. G3-2]PIT72653.1 hypothetical protein B9Z31_12350 [Limnohabitans sp. G3-2]
MHNAPPVAYPVGRFVWGPVLLGGVLFLSAAGLMAWQWQSQASHAMVWGAWIFWAASAAATACAGPRQILSGGDLLWLGETWLWRSAVAADALSEEEQELNVAVGLDWGTGMLLLLQEEPTAQQGRGPWFCAWVSQQTMPSQWHGFRCAVYSRPKPDKPSGLAGL